MIALSKISKQYGPQILFKEASLQISPGEKIGLVGPNGAGKTTLFRVITGTEGIDSGDVSIPDRCIIGYFSQDVGDLRGRSALEEVKAGAGRVSELNLSLQAMEKQLQDSEHQPMDDDAMASLLERYGEAQLEFEQRGGYDLDSRAKEILTGLGIGPDDYHRPCETFSGGWKMRIALATILALQPDVLLVDEPTNHLDLESIIWLEEWLGSFKGSLVMTSHDRDFMNRSVTRIVEVGQKTIASYSGNYEFFEREKILRTEQLKAAHQRQQDMLAKEEEFIARFGARASHAAQVQSRVKKLEKIDRIELPTAEKSVKFQFPESPRSGNDVVKMQSVSKTWGSKAVFSGVTGLVRRLDKVAVVGVNGAGKSTLLKCMAGQTEATDGSLVIGSNVRMGYFSQSSLDLLNPMKTVFDEIHDRIPEATIGFVRNLLGAFLFSGDDVEKKISSLSGGEKSRVVLATILATPVNFLVLDEPTNHLDISTREILMEALIRFDGTIVFVSHDRYFLRKVASRVFEVGNGRLIDYPGDYPYYLRQKAVAPKK